MCAHQSLASPRPGLLLTDLNSNERGDTHEGSEQMLGSSSQRIGVVRSYPRKSQIIHEDDPADHVYEVVSGTVVRCSEMDVGRFPAFIFQAMFLDWKTPKNKTSLSKQSPKLRFGSSKNKR